MYWVVAQLFLDGCIHWLTGTERRHNKNVENLDAFRSQKIFTFYQVGVHEYQGQSVTMWCDLDRAEKEWIAVSPVDKKMIRKFFKMVKDFIKVELPLDLPLSMIPLSRKLKLGLQVFSVWPSYLNTMFQTSAQFAKKFKSPVIRFALTKAQTGYGNLFSMIYSYATVAMGDGGVPKGGKPMVERMKDKFIALGGSY